MPGQEPRLDRQCVSGVLGACHCWCAPLPLPLRKTAMHPPAAMPIGRNPPRNRVHPHAVCANLFLLQHLASTTLAITNPFTSKVRRQLPTHPVYTCLSTAVPPGRALTLLLPFKVHASRSCNQFTLTTTRPASADASETCRCTLRGIACPNPTTTTNTPKDAGRP